jgi:hypothetical protein
MGGGRGQAGRKREVRGGGAAEGGRLLLQGRHREACRAAAANRCRAGSDGASIQTAAPPARLHLRRPSSASAARRAASSGGSCPTASIATPELAMRVARANLRARISKFECLNQAAGKRRPGMRGEPLGCGRRRRPRPRRAPRAAGPRQWHARPLAASFCALLGFPLRQGSGPPAPGLQPTRAPMCARAPAPARLEPRWEVLELIRRRRPRLPGWPTRPGPLLLLLLLLLPLRRRRRRRRAACGRRRRRGLRGAARLVAPLRGQQLFREVQVHVIQVGQPAEGHDAWGRAPGGRVRD